MSDYDEQLREAAVKGNLAQARDLLKRGASVTSADNDWPGRTALHYACEDGHVKVVALLLEHGASLNIIDSNLCRTALHHACEFGHLKVAALLVKQFADRQLRVEAEVIAYLAPRMDRTFRAARDIVAAIDAEALARRRNVTVPLAREVLARLGSAPDTPGTR